jgi:octaprenyl-diphosphate synthase
MSVQPLQDWLDQSTPIAAALEETLQVFDAELETDLPFVRDLISQVRSYRGKLMRPRLVLLSAQAVGNLTPRHATLAAVVEMVHMATLVHDDVLDEADVRRRSATVNRLVGNEAAVMLGDFLISHAYHLCSSLGSTDISRRIAAVTNTVCEGELMQIHHRGDFQLTQEQYLEIIRKKTASLTGVCCELGAELAGASAKDVARLSGFGLDAGIAFQIVDDLLDLTGTVSQTGKSTGRDADMGKVTLPIIMYMDQADAAARDQMLAALAGGAKRSDEIRTLVKNAGAVEEALNVARTHVRSAQDRLDALPASSAKENLLAMADLIISRSH